MHSYIDDLFKAATKLRGKVSPADYKYYVLTLVFLRHISKQECNKTWENIVNISKYMQVTDKSIGQYIDEELNKIVKTHNFNNQFQGIFSNSNIKNSTLVELIELINDIKLENYGGDYLGKVYEYFIGNFAASEGNRGGEFFTPKSVVDLLVKMLKPISGTIYDPACGTGGIFVETRNETARNIKLKFIGQEQNSKTVFLAFMNAKLHNLDLDIKCGDTLLNDLNPELKADYIISNPPFNMKDWGSEQLSEDDPRIISSINKNNANYMWIQHFIYHMAENGHAGFVISNGALTSTNKSDCETRKIIMQNNLLDCVVQLPDKMFFGTAIPSALVFFSKTRKTKDNVLFIDASQYGKLISKTQKELSPEDIDKVATLYNYYKNNKDINYNKDGFSAAISVKKIEDNEYKILPSYYVGVEKEVVNHEENNEKIKILNKKLLKQLDETKIVSLKLKQLLSEEQYDI